MRFHIDICYKETKRKPTTTLVLFFVRSFKGEKGNHQGMWLDNGGTYEVPRNGWLKHTSSSGSFTTSSSLYIAIGTTTWKTTVEYIYIGHYHWKGLHIFCLSSLASMKEVNSTRKLLPLLHLSGTVVPCAPQMLPLLQLVQLATVVCHLCRRLHLSQ